MSEKSSRHQRRPSQGVFINFDDLSSSISDNVAGALISFRLSHPMTTRFVPLSLRRRRRCREV
ncbi:hypothetical protein WN944_011348 [Citrus x changshan-huyou]|uniref:Uncharacterized protein n=1 Tax=Citrus x changshan-huyou TaxID=2935761 RepID=A0AAP0MT86_9ROSI